MTELTESKLEELRAKVKPLIDEIRRKKRMKINEIAYALGYEVKLASFYKWARTENHFPNDFEILDLVEKLEKLLKSSDKETVSTEEVKLFLNYSKKITVLVSIFLNADKKNEIYSGEERATGVILNANGYQAIIAYYNNTSLNRNADGLIYLHDAAAEPTLKYGSIIAIRKIKKEDWRPGYFYLIIDTSEQLFVRKIMEGNSDDEVILISENEKRYPNFRLPLSKIVAMFRVEKMTVDP
jgi:hypothetical protein